MYNNNNHAIKKFLTGLMIVGSLGAAAIIVKQHQAKLPERLGKERNMTQRQICTDRREYCANVKSLINQAELVRQSPDLDELEKLDSLSVIADRTQVLLQEYQEKHDIYQQRIRHLDSMINELRKSR